MSGDRCKTYDRVDFPTQRTQTLTNGFWEFEDLTEGYYEVNVGDVGFKPANIDANSKIDDDASTTADEERTRLVKGERDLASGNNFYIYDGGKDDDDGLASLVVMGTQNVNDGEEALTGLIAPPAQDKSGAMGSIDAITWFSESITVIPKIAAGAKYTVTIPGTTALMVVVGRGTGASTDDGVEFKLPDYGTGHATAEGMARTTTVMVTVTAANGYNDHEYSFDISRAAPVGDELAGLSVKRGTFSGAPVALEPGFDAAEDEYRVSIPATVMSLHLAATLQDVKQEGMTVVTRNNDGTTSEIDRAPSRTSDPVTMHRFDVPVGGTTIASVIVLTVISEDEEEREIEININRGDGPTTPPATLTALTLSGVTLAFASATTTTRPVWRTTVDKTTVTATAATGATAEITPADADANTAGHQVDLLVGETAISIAVTGAGMTPRTYTVTVTRRADGPTTPAAVTLVLTPSSISENGDVSVVTATVSPASATAFDMTVSAAAVDPAVAGDYNLSTNTTLSFAANAAASTGAVTIIAVNNNVAAADKTVTVSGAVPTGITAPADQTLTIEDDDVGSPTVTLVLSPMTISEKDDPATRIAVENVSLVSATLSEAVAQAFTVTIAAAPVAPAVAGDFTLSENMVLSFAANATTSTGEVAIEAVDDG